MAGVKADQIERIFGPVCAKTRCTDARRRTLEEVIQLAVEIAREGREGRKIGTLFVVGDVEGVLTRSQPLLLDPLYGHPDELLNIQRPDLRETSFAALATPAGDPEPGFYVLAYRAPRASAEDLMDHTCAASG